MIERVSYQDHPPRDEYFLTRAGRDLLPILIAFKEWGDAYCRGSIPTSIYEHSCGAKLRSQTVCGACGEVVKFEDLRVVGGSHPPLIAGSRPPLVLGSRCCRVRTVRRTGHSRHIQRQTYRDSRGRTTAQPEEVSLAQGPNEPWVVRAKPPWQDAAMAVEPAGTKQELAYVAIRKRIFDGIYGPGYRIVIDALADELEVSALPVREAIRRLEAEGLVVYRPNYGAHVAPADPELFEEEMTVLAVLEGFATAAAAPEMRSQDFALLAAINAGMTSAMKDLDPVLFGSLNHDFHQVIYDRCPNPSLANLIRDVNGRLALMRRTVFVQIPNRGKDSIREHREIISLLRRGSPSAEIESVARNHKLHTVEAFRRRQAEQMIGSPSMARRRA